MSAPPVLRPLRAILQRRLQTVPSRPTQTPYYLRASHYRSQLRYNTSIPPDQPSKPKEPSRETSSQQTFEDESTSTTKPTEETQNVTAGSPTGNADGSVVTRFEVPGQDAIMEAAVPRLDHLLVKSTLQQLKTADAEIQAGIAETLARQLAADEATTVAVGDAVVGHEAEVRGAPGPARSEPTVEDGAEAKATQPEFVVSQDTEFASLPQEANTSTREAPVEQQKVPESVASETTKPALSSAEGVATMPEPAEPAGSKPETPAVGQTSTEDAMSKPVEAESESVVKPVPDVLPLEEETVVAMTQELERLDKKPEATDVQPQIPSVPESKARSAVTRAPEQTATLESTVAAELPVDNQGEASSVDHSLDAVREEELEKLDAMDATDDAARQELEAVGLYEGPEPSRTPRNVAAYYLQPLRRVAEYGVPACDLQLRSYSVRPLESFCDFALRAAYYLGLPAYGPVPLPKIIERWTVPRSHFIFKKSQENYERITRRRLIQIKDANPETVQVWLAFLQKHQQAGVGMKANLWEFSSIDVAKQLNEAYEEAEPHMKEKYRLLQQNREFETVEKADEFLQATRYKVTGDQVERKQ